MNRNDFLNATIDDGIMEITTTYLRPDQKLKRDGAIKGFNECRGKTDEELQSLLTESREIIRELRADDDNRYWYFVMRERQIEWVIGVLSARDYLDGKESGVATARTARKAMSILGMKELA